MAVAVAVGRREGRRQTEEATGRVVRLQSPELTGRVAAVAQPEVLPQTGWTAATAFA